jgi:hypothetical protein
MTLKQKEQVLEFYKSACEQYIKNTNKGYEFCWRQYKKETFQMMFEINEGSIKNVSFESRLKNTLNLYVKVKNKEFFIACLWGKTNNLICNPKNGATYCIN